MPEDNISAAVISEVGGEPRRFSPEPHYYARSVHLNAAAHSACIPANIEYNSVRAIKRDSRIQSTLERTEKSQRSVSLVDSGDTVNGNRELGNIRPASASADADQCGSASSPATVQGEDSPNFRGGEGAAISKQSEGTVVNSRHSKGVDDSGFITPRATGEYLNNKHYVCPGAPKKPVTLFRIRNRDLRSVARRLNFDDLATWESSDMEVIEVRNNSIG